MTSFAVGAVACAVLVVVVDDDELGSPVIRAISSDSASACFDRSEDTAASAGCIGGFAVVATSLASWLSLRALSSCAMRSSRSGGGGGLPHAAAVTPGGAAAAVPDRPR